MKTLLIVWGLTCGGDAGTTAYILRTGGVETWLPTQNPAVAASVAGGTCVAGIPAINRLSKDHPTAAKVIGWSIVAVRGSIVAHNAEQIYKHRR